MLAAADDIPGLVRMINAAYEVEKYFVSGDRTDAESVRRLMTKGAFGRFGGLAREEARGKEDVDERAAGAKRAHDGVRRWDR